MLQDLDNRERMQLMKFICSFAWADLEVHAHERDFVVRMVRRLELDPEERGQVDRWLELPPLPDEVDPTLVPFEHRKTFVNAIVGIIESDGLVSEEERDSLALFEHLLP